MRKTVRIVGLSLLLSTVASEPSLATSDPTNADCENVPMMKSMSRDMDRYNQACPSGLALCGAIKARIEDQSSAFPGLVIETDQKLRFDLKQAGKIIKINPRLLSCDPELDDCERPAITYDNLQKIYPSAVEQERMMQTLPSANFQTFSK